MVKRKVNKKKGGRRKKGKGFEEEDAQYLNEIREEKYGKMEDSAPTDTEIEKYKKKYAIKGQDDRIEEAIDDYIDDLVMKIYDSIEIEDNDGDKMNDAVYYKYKELITKEIYKLFDYKKVSKDLQKILIFIDENGFVKKVFKYVACLLIWNQLSKNIDKLNGDEFINFEYINELVTVLSEDNWEDKFIYRVKRKQLQIPEEVYKYLIDKKLLKDYEPKKKIIVGIGKPKRGGKFSDIFSLPSKAINKVKEVAKSIFKPDYSNFPEPSKKVLEERGNVPIIELEITRVPLSGAIKGLINALTMGKFNEGQKDSGYDKFFHLALVATVRTIKGQNLKVVMQKNARVEITKEVKEGANTEYLKLPLKGFNMSVNELLDLTRKRIGDTNFFRYDSFNNNCQIFVKELLTTMNLYDKKAADFVYQDTLAIIKKVPSWNREILNWTTDAGNVFSKLTGSGKKLYNVNYNMKRQLKRKGKGFEEEDKMYLNEIDNPHQGLTEGYAPTEEYITKYKKKYSLKFDEDAERINSTIDAALEELSKKAIYEVKKEEGRAIYGEEAEKIIKKIDSSLDREKVIKQVKKFQKWAEKNSQSFNLQILEYRVIVMMLIQQNIWQNLNKEIGDNYKKFNKDDDLVYEELTKEGTPFYEVFDAMDNLGIKFYNVFKKGEKFGNVKIQKEVITYFENEGIIKAEPIVIGIGRRRKTAPKRAGKKGGKITDVFKKIKDSAVHIGNVVKDSAIHSKNVIKDVGKKAIDLGKKSVVAIYEDIKRRNNDIQRIEDGFKKVVQAGQLTVANKDWWNKTMTTPDTYILLVSTAFSVASIAGVPAAGTLAAATKILGDLGQGRPIKVSDINSLALSLIPVPQAGKVVNASMFDKVKTAMIGAKSMTAAQRAAIIGKNVVTASNSLVDTYGKKEGGRKRKLKSLLDVIKNPSLYKSDYQISDTNAELPLNYMVETKGNKATNAPARFNPIFITGGRLRLGKKRYGGLIGFCPHCFLDKELGKKRVDKKMSKKRGGMLFNKIEAPAGTSYKSLKPCDTGYTDFGLTCTRCEWKKGDWHPSCNTYSKVDWKDVEDSLKKAFEPLTHAFSDIKDSFDKFEGMTEQALQDFGGKLRDNFGGYSDWLLDKFDPIFEQVKQFVDSIISLDYFRWVISNPEILLVYCILMCKVLAIVYPEAAVIGTLLQLLKDIIDKKPISFNTLLDLAMNIVAMFVPTSGVLDDRIEGIADLVMAKLRGIDATERAYIIGKNLIALANALDESAGGVSYDEWNRSYESIDNGENSQEAINKANGVVPNAPNLPPPPPDVPLPEGGVYNPYDLGEVVLDKDLKRDFRHYTKKDCDKLTGNYNDVTGRCELKGDIAKNYPPNWSYNQIAKVDYNNPCTYGHIGMLNGSQHRLLSAYECQAVGGLTSPNGECHLPDGRNVADCDEPADPTTKGGRRKKVLSGATRQLHIHSVNIRNTVPLKEAQKMARNIMNTKKDRYHRETKNFIRFRHIPKTKFQPKSYVTKKVNKDVEIVFGKLK